MSDPLDDFLARRWRQIEILLFTWGFDLGGQLRTGEDLGWDPLVVLDPPTGTITAKASCASVPGAFASFSERWSTIGVGKNCRPQEAFWLTRYSYHFQLGGAAIRFDFDPVGHPEVEYHFHPVHDPRTGIGKQWLACSPMQLRQALSAGLAWFIGADVDGSYVDALDADLDEAGGVSLGEVASSE